MGSTPQHWWGVAQSIGHSRDTWRCDLQTPGRTHQHDENISNVFWVFVSSALLLVRARFEFLVSDRNTVIHIRYADGNLKTAGHTVTLSLVVRNPVIFLPDAHIEHQLPYYRADIQPRPDVCLASNLTSPSMTHESADKKTGIHQNERSFETEKRVHMICLAA